ncbi:MAG TPA: hypothetical protein VF189_00195 [Patescibacteria group bacterium]
MKDTQPQKHIVTGYFHTHSFGLKGEQKKQYSKAIKGHATLALEKFGHTSEDNHKLREWVTTGTIPSRSEMPAYEDHILTDVRQRLLIAIKSPILNDAFYADSKYQQSRRANKEDEGLTWLQNNLSEIIINGWIKTPKMYENALSMWNNIAAKQAIMYRNREGHMTDNLRQKIRSTSPSRKIFWPVGLFHVVGINKLLKNDPLIDFNLVMEKPAILRLSDGLILAHRLGKRPSRELIAKSLFEYVLYYGMQLKDIKIASRNMEFACTKFVKNLAASLTTEEIQSLLMSQKDRTERQFIQKVVEKSDLIRSQRQRRQIPPIKNAPDILSLLRKNVMYDVA